MSLREDEPKNFPELRTGKGGLILPQLNVPGFVDPLWEVLPLWREDGRWVLKNGGEEERKEGWEGKCGLYIK